MMTELKYKKFTVPSPQFLCFPNPVKCQCATTINFELVCPSYDKELVQNKLKPHVDSLGKKLYPRCLVRTGLESVPKKVSVM